MASQAMDVYVPYATGAGANVQEAQWTTMFRRLAQTGVVNGLASSMAVIAGTGLQVIVGTGGCWIEGHFGQLTATRTINLAAADPTNDRIDLIVARNDWTAKTIAVDVLTGTPSGSPVAPSLTQTGPPAGIWEIALAAVAVTHNTSTLGANAITDQRSLVTINTALNAVGVIPFGTTAARTALTGLANGARYFDTTLGQDFTWINGGWVAAAASSATGGALLYLAATYR